MASKTYAVVIRYSSGAHHAFRCEAAGSTKADIEAGAKRWREEQGYTPAPFTAIRWEERRG